MSVKTKSGRKGLSHEASKAQTRARLIAVGRKHFLNYGFGKAIAEEISREAGYTRGALHSNFENKEGLLLEVVRESYQAESNELASMMQCHSGAELLSLLRESTTRSLTDPNYVLELEFEFEALRDEKLYAAFLDFQEQLMARICSRPDQADSSLHHKTDPSDLILAVYSFRRGLLLTQRLLKAEMPPDRSRRMMNAFFDSLAL
jgi:AcrR family transcriptional regulator